MAKPPPDVARMIAEGRARQRRSELVNGAILLFGGLGFRIGLPDLAAGVMTVPTYFVIALGGLLLLHGLFSVSSEEHVLDPKPQCPYVPVDDLSSRRRSGRSRYLGACGKSDNKQPSANEPVSPPANGSTAKPVPPQKAPTRGPEHPVYSLVDNRLSAHLVRGGGLVVPAGSAGFAKYVRLGNLMKGWKRQWELRQSEGEIEGRAHRRQERRDPRAAHRARDQPRRRSACARSRRPTVDRIAGSACASTRTRISTAKIAAGWSTVELKVPSGQLVDGENTISVFAQKPGLEIAWLQIGGQSAAPDDAPLRFYDTSGQEPRRCRRAAAMSWYVAVPDDGEAARGSRRRQLPARDHATGDDGTTAEGKLVGTGAAVDLAHARRQGRAHRPRRERPCDEAQRLERRARRARRRARRRKRGDRAEVRRVHRDGRAARRSRARVQPEGARRDAELGEARRVVGDVRQRVRAGQRVAGLARVDLERRTTSPSTRRWR